MGANNGISSGTSEFSTISCSNSSLPYRNSASLNFFARLVVGVVTGFDGEDGLVPDAPPWLERVRNLWGIVNDVRMSEY